MFTMSTPVLLRRAYDPPGRNDGYRVLVDRIWPRGVSKEALQLDEWNRDGDGRTTAAGTVVTDDLGVARFDVPLQAIFALTTA